MLCTRQEFADTMGITLAQVYYLFRVRAGKGIAKRGFSPGPNTGDRGHTLYEFEDLKTAWFAHQEWQRQKAAGELKREKKPRARKPKAPKPPKLEPTFADKVARMRANGFIVGKIARRLHCQISDVLKVL